MHSSLSISPTTSHASVCLVSGYVLPVTGSSDSPSTELVLESTMQLPESKQQLPPHPFSSNQPCTHLHPLPRSHTCSTSHTPSPTITHISWDIPVPRKPISPVLSPLGQLYPMPLVRLDGDVLHMPRDLALLGRYGAVPDVPAWSCGCGLLC